MPNIQQFTVTRDDGSLAVVVMTEDYVTITWDVADADKVKLEPYGDVAPAGHQRVQLLKTTTFSL